MPEGLGFRGYCKASWGSMEADPKTCILYSQPQESEQPQCPYTSLPETWEALKPTMSYDFRLQQAVIQPTASCVQHLGQQFSPNTAWATFCHLSNYATIEPCCSPLSDCCPHYSCMTYMWTFCKAMLIEVAPLFPALSLPIQVACL